MQIKANRFVHVLCQLFDYKRRYIIKIFCYCLCSYVRDWPNLMVLENTKCCSPCYSSCFHFRSCPLILRCIPRQLSRNETPLLQKTISRLQKLLLGNLRTNGERVILPSSQRKIKKKYPLH